MSAAARRQLVRAAQLVLVAWILWVAARRLAGEWELVRARAGSLDPDWPLVAASLAVVLATYTLLAESWRRLVIAWGAPLGRRDAVRIYLVSKLGVYVPGKVWQVAVMGLMARRRGVSPVVAGGSAVVGTLVNLAAGFAVMTVAGARVLRALGGQGRSLAATVTVLAIIGLLLLPRLLPPLARLAGRVLRRDLAIPALGPATLAQVVGANVLAWIGYGVGFLLLARALLPGSAGNPWEYLAVFTGSYLAGYLAVVVPGGLGVREGAMVTGLTSLGLADAADAVVLALGSRVWLTVLEVLPGLALLARDAALRAPTPPTDVPS